MREESRGYVTLDQLLLVTMQDPSLDKATHANELGSTVDLFPLDAWFDNGVAGLCSYGKTIRYAKLAN